MGNIVLKERPEDFLVVENLAAPRISAGAARFAYFIMRKSGYTTFDAVAAVAALLDLPPHKIRYAGLKDEDAITEQMIAVEGLIADKDVDRLNNELRCADRFVQLCRYGQSDESIDIGNLHGNNFRIVARAVSPAFAARMQRCSRQPVYFLNYYDTQRFGVPHGPKTTQLVGQALLAGDYGTAFSRLQELKSSEGDRALAFRGAPDDFFSTLEPRVVNFFKSAYASYVWNEALSEEVRATCGGDTYEERHELLLFLLTARQDLLLSILARRPALEYRRFYGNCGAAGVPAPRATVIQTHVICNAVAADERRPGTCACDLSFFLPSGCYATMFVRQLVNTVDL